MILTAMGRYPVFRGLEGIAAVAAAIAATIITSNCGGIAHYADRARFLPSSAPALGFKDKFHSFVVVFVKTEHKLTSW